MVRWSHGVAFQNCWVCGETRIEVSTAGLDSGIVGRTMGMRKWCRLVWFDLVMA